MLLITLIIQQLTLHDAIGFDPQLFREENLGDFGDTKKHRKSTISKTAIVHPQLFVNATPTDVHFS